MSEEDKQKLRFSMKEYEHERIQKNNPTMC